MILAVLSLQNNLLARQTLPCLDIFIDLIVKAALQFCAHSGKLCRVERDVLNTCRISRNSREVLHPCSATKLTTARTGTSDTSCFLTDTNLAHLNPYVESSCKVLDELTEVDTLIGNIIEDSLVAIALILDITDFHIQTQALGNLPALNHRLMFAGFCLTVLVHIDWLSLTVDALDVVRTLEVCLLNLQENQSSCQGNNTYIMTGISLNGNIVALDERQVVDIVIISLSCILELNLNEVSAFSVSRHISKPVVCIELAVLTSASVATESAVAAVPQLEFHILIIHIYSIS